MKNRVALALVAVVAGGLFGATLGSGPAGAVDENCKTVTQNMVRPDSAVVGGHNWATDTFVRTVKVCVEPVVMPEVEKALVAVTTATFKVVGEDVGTFKTIGIKSSNNNPMVPGIEGTFAGKFTATYVAPYDPANPTNWPFWSPSGTNADSTGPWVDKLWSEGHEGKLTSWAWKYVSCNQQHIQSADGNSGDITGLSLGDIDKCLDVSYKVQCDGKVDVTVVNKLAPGVKVWINGSLKTLVMGTNTFTGVTTTDGWLEVKFLDRTIKRVRCIKPTVCATPTATPTPTVTPTVVPTTPPATTPAPLYANCDAVRAAGKAPILSTEPGYTLDLDSDKDGIGCEVVEGNAAPGGLALTGTSGGNPVPWIAGSGAFLILAGAGLMFLIRRNRQDSLPTLVEGDEDRPNDTVTFYPQH